MTKLYSIIFIIKKTATCWLKLNQNDLKNLIQFLILHETYATYEAITITYQWKRLQIIYEQKLKNSLSKLWKKCLSRVTNAINVRKKEQRGKEKMDTKIRISASKTYRWWSSIKTNLSSVFETSESISWSEVLIAFIKKIERVRKSLNISSTFNLKLQFCPLIWFLSFFLMY